MNSGEDMAILHSSVIAPSANEHRKSPEPGSPRRPCQAGDSNECRFADWPQQKFRQCEDVESPFELSETGWFKIYSRRDDVWLTAALICAVIFLYLIGIFNLWNYTRFVQHVYKVLVLIGVHTGRMRVKTPLGGSTYSAWSTYIP